MSIKWDAKWIWIETSMPQTNVYTEARTEFKINANPIKASINISANQRYQLYINGDLIGSGPSPADNAWKYYDTYDVVDHLNIGMNNISILAYNFGSTDIVTGQRQGPGGLIAQLDVFTEQEVISVYTDESWKCRRSPRWIPSVSRIHQWGGYKEIYLAEQEDGWELQNYDDSEWKSAKVIAHANDIDSFWPRLLPREIPYLSQVPVKPDSVIRLEENYGKIQDSESLMEGRNGRMKIDATVPGSLPGIVFDFSAVKAGYPEIVVTALEGGVLQLSYGESLDMMHIDTFIMKKGPNRLSPFGRRAFRYVKISVQATPVPIFIEDFKMVVTRYPFSQEGTFKCSDQLLNRIWEIGEYTTMVNSQDHLEDCPFREEALWIVDAVVMAKVIYQNFGDTALVRKSLLQGARIQNEDGSIPSTGPERNEFLLPDFNAYWFLGVYDYWRYSGDNEFISGMKDTIVRLIKWFRNQEDKDGLFAGADRNGWWCFVDWADYIDKRDRVTAISCLYYLMLKKASELMMALGEEELASEYSERAIGLHDTIRKLLWNSEKEMYADCMTDDGLSNQFTYQTNFLAIWTGIMTGDETDRFLKNIFFEGRCPELKGAFFYHIVLEVLISRGYHIESLQIMRSYWGEMVSRGATTWWETFDPSTPHSTIPSPYLGNTPTYLVDHIPVSLCHGWGAAPTYILNQKILGIEVSNISTGQFLFRPAIGDLTWVKGTVPTLYGWISAECILESDGQVSVILEYPNRLNFEAPTLETVVTETQGDSIVVQGKLMA